MTSQEPLQKLELSLRVYIEDTDAGGIVFYVNYLKYMERARTELFRSLGYGKAAFFAEDLMFVVHSLHVDYRASAQLDDELVVTAEVKKLTAAAVVFEQQVWRSEQLLCAGDIKVACVRRADRRPAPIPAAVRKKLQSTTILSE